MRIDRDNQTMIGRWVRTVDPYLLIAFGVIIAIGCVLVTTGSPAVAERIGVSHLHFTLRHFVFIGCGIVAIFVISMLEPRTIRRLCTLGLIMSLIAMILVLFFGSETKGSTRWLDLGGFSFQPSEFLKPCFIVFCAWMFSEKLKNDQFPGFLISMLTFATVLTLLVLQPDIGTSVIFMCVWMGMFFIAGLPIVLLMTLVGLAIIGGIAAYFVLPHFTARIDKFLSPTSEENYQVKKSLEAFANGGLFGKGPGEGTVKAHIPDSHTDFIFAVLGEEMGLVAVLLMIGLFLFIILRGIRSIQRQNDFFVTIAVAGILMNFGLQALINMGVTVKLMPTKGMTLPFVSYGGSSTIAQAISIGILVALTRKRYDSR